MASSTDVPLEISGYLIFPLLLPPLPSVPTSATHFLYLAKHQPKVPSATASRSLFLVNVPFDATVAHIKRLFSTQLDLPNGRIEDVRFDGEKRSVEDKDTPKLPDPTFVKKGKKRKHALVDRSPEDIVGAELPSTWDRQLRANGGTAVVVFVDQASLGAVIRATKKMRRDKKQPVWGEGIGESIPALGPSRYLNHHELQYPDKAPLLESVNAFMSAFAAQEAAQAKRLAEQRQEPDDDGFITVTKGGRNGPARHDVALEQAERQKEKHQGLPDFYRFQVREKRKAEAGELLRKFEEDKQKLRRMRDRTFKAKIKDSSEQSET